MSGTQSCRKALETYLKGLDSPEFATEWENVPYTPVDGVPYQKVDFMFAEPFNPEQSGGFYQENGIMQVMLLFPENQGAGDAVTRAEFLRAAFPFGLNLSADGVNVVINRTPRIASGARDGSRYAVPVQIRFYANNAN